MIIARIPLRISLGGGGTDLFHWYKKYNSFLITGAINKYIYLTISKRNLTKNYWLSYSKIENLKNIKKIKHSIIKKILEKYYKNKNLEIHTISEVPSNSGLGSSGSLAVGLIQTLLFQLNKKNISPKYLAEEACKIEMELNKKKSGKQDQYAGAYGGMIKLNINKEGNTKVKRLKISKKKIEELQRNLFLIYIKNRRYAYQVLNKQTNLIRTKTSIVDIMKKIQILGRKSCKIFEKGIIDDYGFILDEHWNLKKKVGKFMTNPIIDKLYDKLKKNGATGGKIIGAGGGGFLMTFVPKKNHSKFRKFLKKQNISVLDWKFHFKGSEIIFFDE